MVAGDRRWRVGDFYWRLTIGLMIEAASSPAIQLQSIGNPIGNRQYVSNPLSTIPNSSIRSLQSAVANRGSRRHTLHLISA
jgi:hypothetical protein